MLNCFIIMVQINPVNLPQVGNLMLVAVGSRELTVHNLDQIIVLVFSALLNYISQHNQYKGTRHDINTI